VAKPALVANNAKGAPAAVPAAAPKKKKPLLLILAILVILLAGGGGAAWWFLRGGHDAPAQAATAKPPLFHALEPFTVNLLEENGDHYLQVAIVLQVEDDKVIDQVKAYLPIIRNKILLLLSSKKPSDIGSQDGKQRLVSDILRVTRESLPGTTPERGVTSAYLGAFVIQ